MDTNKPNGESQEAGEKREFSTTDYLDNTDKKLNSLQKTKNSPDSGTDEPRWEASHPDGEIVELVFIRVYREIRRFLFSNCRFQVHLFLEAKEFGLCRWSGDVGRRLSSGY